ncbi:MAG TPA: MBL fold metallo-hydrolase [Thermoanaerobaculia bacterium]|jgi:glyoxylase-like metal-dependent hydrolase (beta-lactamase superfamily II)
MAPRTDDLYLRQLLAGRQVAKTHPVAAQMANFMYLIGDPATRQAVIVDPAWNVADLLEVARTDGYDVAGVLVTHYHPDHVGGDLFGHQVEGLAKLLELSPAPIYVNKHEAHGLKVVTGVSDSDLKKVDDGDVVRLGEREIRFLHTPGHTPGSQCFLVDGRLVAGDTLFVQGCGRVDLPGGDPEAMYYTLTRKLARLPRETVLYPGHNYGPSETSTIGEELAHNFYMRVGSLDEWRRMMGG